MRPPPTARPAGLGLARGVTVQPGGPRPPSGAAPSVGPPPTTARVRPLAKAIAPGPLPTPTSGPTVGTAAAFLSAAFPRPAAAVIATAVLPLGAIPATATARARVIPRAAPAYFAATWPGYFRTASYPAGLSRRRHLACFGPYRALPPRPPRLCSSLSACQPWPTFVAALAHEFASECEIATARQARWRQGCALKTPGASAV